MENSFVSIQAINSRDDWLRLCRNDLRLSMIATGRCVAISRFSLILVHFFLADDLLDGIISMQALFPLQLLLVDELQAILYPVPEEQSVDHWNLPYT